jgi:hypothetical protein
MRGEEGRVIMASLKTNKSFMPILTLQIVGSLSPSGENG